MDRKQLLNWIYDHIVPISAIALTVLYLMMPYLSYYTFFAAFDVSLNTVGLDRTAILTRAVIALIVSLAVLVLGSTLIMVLGSFMHAASSFASLGLSCAARNVGQILRAVTQRRKSKSLNPNGLPITPVVSSVTMPLFLQILTSRGTRNSRWTRSPSNWFLPQGTQPATPWLVAAMIAVGALAVFLWNQIPAETTTNDGTKRLAYGWIPAVLGTWFYAILCVWLKSVRVRSRELQARIHGIASDALPPAFILAISGSALLLLILSFQIGTLSAVYTYQHGEPPNASNVWSMLNVDVRCVEVEQLVTLETKSSSRLPKTALLYLGEANNNMVLLDLESWISYRVPASNVSIHSVKDSPSPCAMSQGKAEEGRAIPAAHRAA